METPLPRLPEGSALSPLRANDGRGWFQRMLRRSQRSGAQPRVVSGAGVRVRPPVRRTRLPAFSWCAGGGHLSPVGFGG